MNNINFTGSYIKQVTALKNNIPINVSLIKVNQSDLYKIEDVSEKWGTDLSYKIVESMYFPKKYKSQNIFALTTQDKDFQKLNPNKILALFEVTDKDTNYTLEYLDVNPKYKYKDGQKTRKGFSELGTACLDYIKSKFKDKLTDLYSLKSAKEFYKKRGCKPCNDGIENHMFIDI